MTCTFETKFLTALSLLCASQVCVTVYSKAATTTFERRYGLDSSTSSTISLCYNGAAVFGLIFTAIYGNRLHRPKALGLGGLLVALGAFMATLPQFLSPPYKQNGYENAADWSILCSSEKSVADCTAQSDAPSQWFFLLLIAEMIMGLGFSGFMTLGMSYLHDSTPVEKRAFFQGILLTIFIFGPLLAFGFILPAVSMMYVDFYRANGISMDRHDPEWVGAWWLGYLISGSIVTLASIPMFLFPKNPPNFKPIEENDVTISQALKMSKLILSCVVPLILLFNHAISAIPTSAITTYGAKYLERQIGLSAHAASAYYGMVTILSSMMGTFFGGWIHRKLKLQEKGAAAIVLLGAFLVVIFTAPLLFLGCKNPEIQGLSWNDENQLMEIESNFCSGCDCPKNEIQIVQNDGNLLWASPCAAGCKTDLGGSSFSNCTCASDENVSSKIRLCDNSAMYGMLLMWGLMSFSHGITGGPYISLLLSNIPRETKVITFGLMHLLMKVIGFGPGPLIAGVAIDKNCVFWKTSDCGKRESCQLYEFEGYRESFTALMLIPGLLTLPGFILVYWKTSRKERCPLYEIARRESETEKLNPSTSNQ